MKSKMAGEEVHAHIHLGFLERWKKIANPSFVDDLKKQLADKQHVIFTGHSLGGAIATIAQLWYLQNQCGTANCSNIKHINTEYLVKDRAQLQMYALLAGMLTCLACSTACE